MCKGDCCCSFDAAQINADRLEKLSLPARMGFREDAKNPYIPRVWRDFLHSLALKGNADEFWAQPVISIGEERKGAIEITAAHPNAVPVIVECNQRCHDDIEFTWLNARAGYRFPKTEIVLRE